METIGLRVNTAPSGRILAGQPDAARPEPGMTTMQCGIGIYFACIGSLMLVAPHQYSGPLWGAIGQYLPLAGSFFLLMAVVLPGCTALGATRPWVVLAHLAAGAAMLAFVFNFLQTGLLPGVAFHLSIALGIALSPFVPAVERPGRPQSGYLLALLFGTVNSVFGLVILLLPEHLAAPMYDTVRPYLPLYGLGFLLSGTALVVVQCRPRLPGPAVRAAYLGGLVPCAAWVIAVSVPVAGWNGILYFGGLSLIVSSLPWTGPRLLRTNPRTLSFRLSFVLALAVALPLIAVTGLMTSAEERHFRAEVESSQQALATALASDVSNYIGSYRKALVTLAGYPGLLDLPPAAQQAVVRSYGEAYPDAVAAATFDAAGKGIARSDGQPPTDMGGRELVEEFRRTNAPVVGVAIGTVPQVPVFAMFQPIRDAGGRLIGWTGMFVKSENVAALLNRVDPVGGRVVYLVDSAGHAMAHPDRNIAATFADLSPTPAVAAALDSEDEQGIVSYRGPDRDQLAAYARVPGLGWTVVVDRPAAAALATARSARNAAFGALLFVLAMAVVVGAFSARRMARPLASLSEATKRLARGDSGASLPRGGGSEIEGLVSTFEEMRDLLSSRAAEQERLLAELNATFVSVANGLVLFTPEGKVARMNAEAEKITGYTNEQLRERSVEDRTRLMGMESADGKPLPSSGTPGARMARGETYRNLILALVRSDGSRVWVSASGAPIRTETGEVLGGVGTFTDITRQQELQDELARLLLTEKEMRAAAEAAVQTRDEFLSVAAHELKTPVTSLRGYAQALLRQYGKRGAVEPQRLSEALQVIDKQSLKLAKLVSQLLDTSRLDGGRLALARQHVDLVSVVEAVVAAARLHTERHTLVVEALSRVGAFVDPDRIEQVIANLVDNAIRYSPSGGAIEIKVASRDGEGEITVRDHGIGIPPEHCSYVFDRFYRAHEGASVAGLGLGLYVSREIVTQHGGRIDVECPPDGGTRFVVGLPLDSGDRDRHGQAEG